MSFVNNYFRNMINQTRNNRNNRNNINPSPNDIIYTNRVPSPSINDDDTYIGDNSFPSIEFHNRRYILVDASNHNRRFALRDASSTEIQSVINRNRIEQYFYILVSEINRQNAERQSLNPRNRKFNIATQVIKEKRSQLDIECNICYELHNNINFIKLNCNHEFCKECIKNTLKSCDILSDPCCAYCREKINAFTYKTETIQEEFSDLIA